VELEYRERDVRVAGRVAPVLASELEALAARWATASRNGEDDAMANGGAVEAAATERPRKR